MNRVFHHYEDLEEFKCGMWRIVRGRQRIENAKRAAALMRNSPNFALSMRQALMEWPMSCEHNLTSENSNRLAWLGHAGCFLGAGSPEENTRIGWHMLTKQEQDEANETAQMVLEEWLANQREKENQGDLFAA